MNSNRAITLTEPMPTRSRLDVGSVAALYPGARAGRYRVIGKLARGGFGDVWRAEDVASGEVVALKVLHAELLANPSTVARFQRETQAIKRIHHPNVVQLFEVGEFDDGRPYFAMEYLAGEDLERHIRRRGALTPDEVLAVVEPLASALDAVHREGIVHRDLKALNVFLAYDGLVRRVVLLDFGIAKLLEYNGPALTAARCTIGSPACMAPEQIRGEPVDARTDVYALGSLIFQMLTAEMPFPGSGNGALRKHLSERRPRPSERASVSPVFDDVVVRAMAIEPRRRYASGLELAAAFRDALTVANCECRPGRMRALGLYLDLRAADGILVDPDDDLLDDLEAADALANELLETQGWSVALEQGDATLFIRPLDSPRKADAKERRAALDEARRLLAALAGRPRRDPRVIESVQLHVAEIEISRGVPLGGELFHLARWLSPSPRPGLLGSDAMVAGLAVNTRAMSGHPRVLEIVGVPAADDPNAANAADYPNDADDPNDEPPGVDDDPG